MKQVKPCLRDDAKVKYQAFHPNGCVAYSRPSIAFRS